MDERQEALIRAKSRHPAQQASIIARMGDQRLDALKTELATLFEDAGALPLTAYDLSEAICSDQRITMRLRALTGELLLHRDRGLQGNQS